MKSEKELGLLSYDIWNVLASHGADLADLFMALAIGIVTEDDEVLREEMEKSE